ERHLSGRNVERNNRPRRLSGSNAVNQATAACVKVATQPLVEQAGPDRLGVFIDQCDCLPGQRDGLGVLTDQMRGFGGVSVQVDEGECGRPVRAVAALPQLQSLPEVAEALGSRSNLLGG